ncbi:MAG: hypothetical protein WCZ90_00525 [Melioribacteraceae bacterium]
MHFKLFSSSYYCSSSGFNSLPAWFSNFDLFIKELIKVSAYTLESFFLFSSQKRGFTLAGTHLALAGSDLAACGSSLTFTGKHLTPSGRHLTLAGTHLATPKAYLATAVTEFTNAGINFATSKNLLTVNRNNTVPCYIELQINC